MQIIVFGIALLVLGSVLVTNSQMSQTAPYSDTFSSASFNPIWSTYNDSGVGITQSNGVLTAFENSLGSTDLSSFIYKNITSNINRIDVDYSYNFLNGMGRLYLLGRDSTGNKTTFVIGMSDGWLMDNAKPLVYINNQDGVTPNSTTSWNLQDLQAYMVQSTGGTGHITVYFNTSMMITVVFTFPVNNEGLTNLTRTFPLNGPTNQIALDFTFPPANYYMNGECFMFDNYAENGLIPATTMSQTCPVNNTKTVTTTFVTAPNSNTNTTRTTIPESLSITTTPGFEIPMMVLILAIYTLRKKIKFN